MSDISIVTAFFDIGRGDWTPSKGLPHYLERSTETYIERFSHMCKLENEIVVLTSPHLVERLEEVCADRMDRTKIIAFDVQKQFASMRENIERVQKSSEFKNSVVPSQSKNPEYWNPDYVLVTDLKAYFTHYAIGKKLTTNDMVAWIDFGYCRSENNIPPSKKWSYDFDPEKIHLFSYKDFDRSTPVSQAILSNDVYILGAKVVAHKDKWPILEGLMRESFNKLLDNNLVDDDQGLWLVSYLLHPESFQLHKIPDHQLGHDPFVLFNDFNLKGTL
jgi:protein YibB